MFILSQLILKNNFIQINTNSIPSYSIALGLVLYASIYLYILYKHNEYINVFNKFIIYIVSIDLLLSIIYHFSTTNQNKPLKISNTFIESDTINKYNNKIELENDEIELEETELDDTELETELESEEIDDEIEETELEVETKIEELKIEDIPEKQIEKEIKKRGRPKKEV